MRFPWTAWLGLRCGGRWTPGRGALGTGRAGGAPAGLGRAGRAALGEELHRALEGHRIDGVALAEGGVGLPVGDVGAKAAVLDHYGTAIWVLAQLAQRRRGHPAAATGLGLREHLLGLGQIDGEELVLALQRAAVGALLDVGAVPAV